MMLVFIPGINQKTAEALLSIANEVGLPPSSVRSDSDGFYVPEEIAERHAKQADDGKTVKRRKTRRKTDGN